MKKTISIENPSEEVVTGELTASLSNKEAVILTTSKFRYILMNKAFLRRFSWRDHVQVDGQDLYPDWGRNVRVSLNGPDLYLGSCGNAIDEWRFSDLSDDVDIASIRKQLEIARAYVRVCEFTVEDI